MYHKYLVLLFTGKTIPILEMMPFICPTVEILAHEDTVTIKMNEVI